MKTARQPPRTDVDGVNQALHVLLRKLHLTRLGYWSEKLENIHCRGWQRPCNFTSDLRDSCHEDDGH